MRSIRNEEDRKTIFVGFIEKGNKSSYKVTEAAGYKPIPNIQTMGFSRFFPKKSKRVEKVTDGTTKEEVIHNFVKDSQVIIMASYKNLNEEEIKLVEKLPLYAAAFDYI